MPFQKEKVQSLNKKIVDAVLSHVFDSDEEHFCDRIADVAYVLCSNLAMHVDLMSKHSNSSREDIGKMTITTFKEFLEKEDFIGVPKEVLEKYTRLSKTKSRNPFVGMAIYSEDELSKNPPKAIRDLTAFVINEVIKSLKLEGIKIGEMGKGGVIFQKDNDGKVKSFAMKIDFIDKEDKNAGSSSGR